MIIASIIRDLPYAYHSEEEAESLAQAVQSDPAWVYEELCKDAQVHADADNWIKADRIAQVAQYVRALIK